MDATPLYHRFAADRVTTALADTPVVMVVGPRQCGRSTLVRDLVDRTRQYVTLDDATVLDAARSDATGFVRGLDRVTIDEVQRAPGLLQAIKVSVDRDRGPGRFLLTGSANVLTLPTVTESLAGRMEVVTLLPLSRAETRGHRAAFLPAAFAGTLIAPPEVVIGPELVRVVLAGGYPEMLRRAPGRQHAWARDYIQALVQRDVRDIADIERLDHMSRLLRVLALHSGQLTNFSSIGGHVGLDDKTIKRYVTILEQLFLLRRVEPWFHNQLKRLVKTPKLHFLDSGLLAAIRGVTTQTLARDRTPFGPLLEAHVTSEVLKHASWMDSPIALSHYRDKDQAEVDLIVENNAGELVGIEVKAAASVNAGDFAGLRKIASVAGDALTLGVVLYDGELTVPFGDRMYAAPVSCVWG